MCIEEDAECLVGANPDRDPTRRWNAWLEPDMRDHVEREGLDAASRSALGCVASDDETLVRDEQHGAGTTNATDELLARRELDADGLPRGADVSRRRPSGRGLGSRPWTARPVRHDVGLLAVARPRSKRPTAEGYAKDWE
jgi:hypothetical protein